MCESTHVKIPHCWKSHVAAHICNNSHEFFTGWFLLTCPKMPRHQVQGFAGGSQVILVKAMINGLLMR